MEQTGEWYGKTGHVKPRRNLAVGDLKRGRSSNLHDGSRFREGDKTANMGGFVSVG